MQWRQVAICPRVVLKQPGKLEAQLPTLLHFGSLFRPDNGSGGESLLNSVQSCGQGPLWGQKEQPEWP